MKPRYIVRIAIAALLLAGTAVAQAQVSVNINIAPPPPRYEALPVLRPGQVWAPGYWAWDGNRYGWVRGHQIPQRPGHHWVADHWMSGNRYRAGYWAPDRGDEGRREAHHYGEREWRHDRDRDRDHGNGNGFCPPGQAKKGNC